LIEVQLVSKPEIVIDKNIAPQISKTSYIYSYTRDKNTN